MKELVTYINEGFYKNAGTENSVLIAKGQDIAEDFEDFIKKNSDEIYRISDTYQQVIRGSKAFIQARQEVLNMNAEIEKRFISKLPINGILLITTKSSRQKLRNGQALDFVLKSSPAFRKLAEGSDRQASLAQVSVRTNLETNPSSYDFSTYGSFSANINVAKYLLAFLFLKQKQDNKYCIAFYYDK